MSGKKEMPYEKEAPRAVKGFLNSRSVRSLMVGVMRMGVPRLVIRDGVVWGYEKVKKIKKRTEEAEDELIRD